MAYARTEEVPLDKKATSLTTQKQPHCFSHKNMTGSAIFVLSWASGVIDDHASTTSNKVVV